MKAILDNRIRNTYNLRRYLHQMWIVLIFQLIFLTKQLIVTFIIRNWNHCKTADFLYVKF